MELFGTATNTILASCTFTFNNSLVTSTAFDIDTGVLNLYHGIVNLGSSRFSGAADMAFKSRIAGA